MAQQWNPDGAEFDITQINNGNEYSIGNSAVAIEDFNDMINGVQFANNNSVSAFQKSESALTNSNNALIRVDVAINDISTFKQNITEQQNATNTKSEQALTTATSAKSLSEVANGKSDTALGKANIAETKAREAETAATNAANSASAAQSQAETAQTAATNAANSASNSQLAAEAAQRAAEQAAEVGGSVVNINNVPQATINFSSDPQTQLNTHQSQLSTNQTQLNTLQSQINAILIYCDGTFGQEVSIVNRIQSDINSGRQNLSYKLSGRLVVSDSPQFVGVGAVNDTNPRSFMRFDFTNNANCTVSLDFSDCDLVVKNITLNSSSAFLFTTSNGTLIVNAAKPKYNSTSPQSFYVFSSYRSRMILTDCVTGGSLEQIYYAYSVVGTGTLTATNCVAGGEVGNNGAYYGFYISTGGKLDAVNCSVEVYAGYDDDAPLIYVYATSSADTIVRFIQSRFEYMGVGLISFSFGSASKYIVTNSIFPYRGISGIPAVDSTTGSKIWANNIYKN